jgi:hypothetical protein
MDNYGNIDLWKKEILESWIQKVWNSNFTTPLRKVPIFKKVIFKI